MALNEAKERVCQLENAIKKLDLVKKHLSRNAADIKGEIHSCVSHNLECLRGREVSLLNRVDTIVGLKEEALQDQQAQLNQALGMLQTRMALITGDSVLDKQMADILTKLNEIELSPGETPHIAFRADHVSLREGILNYGRVDANALPLHTAFDDSRKPSASLPRHVEEYEDVDHHIFYKTVEDLKKTDSTTKSITVTIPKLSTKMEDWLQKRLPPQEQVLCPPLVRPVCLPNSNISDVNIKSKSASSTPGDISSLNNWLCQIKNHADLEEEHDFEIVDNSQRRTGKKCCSKRKHEDLKQWLHSSDGHVEGLVENQTLDLFKHIPSDSKYWLRQACQQKCNDEMKQNLFDHISKEPATWLRTRAQSKHSQEINENEEESKKDKAVVFKENNMTQWLVQNSNPVDGELENGNNNCCPEDCWLQVKSSVSNMHEGKSALKDFQLEDLCKANELCSSLLDCVCNPNCAIQCQEEFSKVKNPIDPTKVFKPLQLPQSEWLYTSESSDGTEKMDICDEENIGEKEDRNGSLNKGIFNHIADISNDQWLSRPSDSHLKTVDNFPVFKQSKEETNRWLQQTKDFSSTTGEESDPVMLNIHSSPNTLSQWLMAPTNMVLESKEEEDVKEESEGWSICSSPSSLNSEQFTKDVRVATTYLQNWLL